MRKETIFMKMGLVVPDIFVNQGAENTKKRRMFKHTERKLFAGMILAGLAFTIYLIILVMEALKWK